VHLSPELQAYFDAWPAERDRRLRAIHRRILHFFPDAEVTMRFRMPTYEVGPHWMAIANQNEYLSVYTSKRVHLRPYLKRHPATFFGRFCLHFADNVDIDMDALDEVIRHSLDPPTRRSQRPAQRRRPARAAK
jgi:hypothetical protein